MGRPRPPSSSPRCEAGASRAHTGIEAVDGVRASWWANPLSAWLLPAAITQTNAELAWEISDLMSSPRFRVFTTKDVIGVEVSGAPARRSMTVYHAAFSSSALHWDGVDDM